MLTLVPWRGTALVGTSQSRRFAQPGDTSGRRRRKSTAFIADANDAFPALNLTRARRHARAPRRRPGGVDARRRARPEAVARDSRSRGRRRDGAMTVVGAKYTTARGVAEQVTTVRSPVVSTGGVPPSRTATTTLPGAGIADHEALAIETARDIDVDLPLPVIRHLIAPVRGSGAAHHQADAGASRPRAAPWRPASPHSAPRCSTSSVTRWRCGSPTSSSAAPAWARQGGRPTTPLRSVHGLPPPNSAGTPIGPLRRSRRSTGYTTIDRRLGLGTRDCGLTGSVKPLNTQVTPAVKPNSDRRTSCRR